MVASDAKDALFEAQEAEAATKETKVHTKRTAYSYSLACAHSTDAHTRTTV